MESDTGRAHRLSRRAGVGRCLIDVLLLRKVRKL
jgi:hypothetical protein